MKKLLSLLSVLTISGTAVPTTIAASPYKKEENISNNVNYQQINNLETLNRNKRAIPSLNIPEVQQLECVWCGPAVAESILRYMGITWENVVRREQLNPLSYNNQFQSYLSRLVQTEPEGTLPFNLLEVINTFIRTYIPTYHSSVRNFYGLANLGNDYNNYKQFYELVRNSLNNNMPVIIQFSGTLPGWSECSSSINHYMIIYSMTEVQNNDYSSVNYSYMDPANGLNRGVFTGDDLTREITAGSTSNFLFYYEARLTEWNDVNRNQQEELINIDYPTVHCSVNQASQRKKRSNESKIQCASKKEFYFDEKNKNNKVIETWYGSENHHKTTNKELFTFNLKNINPLYFKNIEILFDNDSDISTYVSLGNDGYYGEKITDFFKNKSIKQIIKNKKIDDRDQVDFNDMYYLQSINPNNLIATQKVGLTFYWEDNNYYLQISIYQFAENYRWFPQGGTVWMKIGKGIKLYN